MRHTAPVIRIVLNPRQLSVCIQQRKPVPAALAQSAYDFQRSSARQRWRKQNLSSPKSIFMVSLQVVNLWAAIGNVQHHPAHGISEQILDIVHQLEQWRDVLAPNWLYGVVTDPASGPEDPFCGQQHVYPNNWVTEVWNNWRILRILIYKILLQSQVEPFLDDRCKTERGKAQSIIRDLSLDICISACTMTKAFRESQQYKVRWK